MRLKTVLVVLALVAYLIWPLDAIPDPALPIGLVDDSLLILGAIGWGWLRRFRGRAGGGVKGSVGDRR